MLVVSSSSNAHMMSVTERHLVLQQECHLALLQGLSNSIGYYRRVLPLS